jgi:hypothetical protein
LGQPQPQEPAVQDTYATNGLSPEWLIVCVVVAVFEIASMWRMFEKAGKPGWAAIIPIYNAIVIIQIAGKPAWWFLLYLIPIVNIVIAVIVMLNLARSFGKGTGFALGLIFLSGIFIPILAWGDAHYQPQVG